VCVKGGEGEPNEKHLEVNRTAPETETSVCTRTGVEVLELAIGGLHPHHAIGGLRDELFDVVVHEVRLDLL
jgi:hypothetical protein